MGASLSRPRAGKTTESPPGALRGPLLIGGELTGGEFIEGVLKGRVLTGGVLTGGVFINGLLKPGPLTPGALVRSAVPALVGGTEPPLLGEPVLAGRAFEGALFEGGLLEGALLGLELGAFELAAGVLVFEGGTLALALEGGVLALEDGEEPNCMVCTVLAGTPNAVRTALTKFSALMDSEEMPPLKMPVVEVVAEDKAPRGSDSTLVLLFMATGRVLMVVVTRLPDCVPTFWTTLPVLTIPAAPALTPVTSRPLVSETSWVGFCA